MSPLPSPVGRGHALALDAITHRFRPTTVVSDVSLAIGAGAMVALLGPSGCGESTLLRIVAGCISPSAGCVSIDGKPVGEAARPR